MNSLKTLYTMALNIEERIAQNGKLSIEDHQLFTEALSTQEDSKLKALTSRVQAGMSLRQFICFVVPIERALKISTRDCDILITKEDSESKPVVHNLKVIADNIRSPFNLGALARSCDAMGVMELITTGYSPEIHHEKVSKTSMGANDKLSHTYVRHVETAIKSCQSEGFQVVALETTTSAQYYGQFHFPQKTALVVGNERFGLDEQTLTLCDAVIALPVFGYKNSLNINAAFTTIGYEWIRQHAAY